MHYSIRVPNFRFIVLLATLFLTACSSITGPVQVAETTEQKAFALYGEYVVFKELAADVVEDNGVPLKVRRQVQNANRTVTPVARSLRDTALEVERIRLQVEAGTNTAERLDIVTANLANYLNTSNENSAASLIQNLIDAVRDGR